MIPAQAVEAATEALLTALASGIDGAYIQEDDGPSNCVIDGHGLDVPACVAKALEAAAPHMLVPADAEQAMDRILITLTAVTAGQVPQDVAFTVIREISERYTDQRTQP